MRQHIRVQSSQWHSIETVPLSYRESKELRVFFESLLIPIQSVKEIRIHDRDLGVAWRSALPHLHEYAVAGAVGGFLGVLSFFAESMVERDFDPDITDDRDILVFSAIGAAGGAILYPIYKMFKPQYKQHVTTYLIDGEEGYRIGIRPFR